MARGFEEGVIGAKTWNEPGSLQVSISGKRNNRTNDVRQNMFGIYHMQVSRYSLSTGTKGKEYVRSKK